MNNFKYSNDNKRYHTFNYYLKTRYGIKVSKISLNGNFTCPNRDGKISYGGCIFCSDSGSGEFAGNPQLDLIDQFTEVKKRMNKKWPHSKYIAYFQANTNTYDTVDNLRQRFEPFTDMNDVVGISLGTRPDCLDNDVLDYLEDLNKRCDLWVELGLQTVHDKTAVIINRGYTYDIFLEAIKELRRRNINICVHIINGLPGETYTDMLETAKKIGCLDIQAIKIHVLYILSGTAIYNLYKNNQLSPLTRNSYINLVVDQLEYIDEKIVVQRLTGDGDSNELIEPTWITKKVTVLNDIDKEFVKRDSFQGKKR